MTPIKLWCQRTDRPYWVEYTLTVGENVRGQEIEVAQIESITDLKGRSVPMPGPLDWEAEITPDDLAEFKAEIEIRHSEHGGWIDD